MALHKDDTGIGEAGLHRETPLKNPPKIFRNNSRKMVTTQTKLTEKTKQVIESMYALPF